MCVGIKKRRGWGRPVRGSIVFFALFLVLHLGTQKNRNEVELSEANNKKTLSVICNSRSAEAPASVALSFRLCL
jgi:hypothetical protein